MWFVSDDISIKSTRANTKITDCIDDITWSTHYNTLNALPLWRFFSIIFSFFHSLFSIVNRYEHHLSFWELTFFHCSFNVYTKFRHVFSVSQQLFSLSLFVIIAWKLHARNGELNNNSSKLNPKLNGRHSIEIHFNRWIKQGKRCLCLYTHAVDNLRLNKHFRVLNCFWMKIHHF